MKAHIQKENNLRLYVGGAFYVLVLFLTALGCTYFCITMDVFVYRMAAIFLSLILISNLSVRFFLGFFNLKR